MQPAMRWLHPWAAQPVPPNTKEANCVKVRIRLRDPSYEKEGLLYAIDDDEFVEIPWHMKPENCPHDEAMCPECRESWEIDHVVRTEPESDFEIIEETLYNIRQVVTPTTSGAITSYLSYWMPIAPDQHDEASQRMIDLVGRFEDFANFLRKNRFGILPGVLPPNFGKLDIDRTNLPPSDEEPEVQQD